MSEPRQRIIPVFVPHLGCPNDCVFCNQRHISGQLTPATAQTVHEAISFALSTGLTEPAQLAFYGGSFTAIPADMQESLLAAASGYIDKGIISSIRLSTRPDAINAEVLERLKKYRVEIIELGAQSLDDEVLIKSARGHSASDVLEASKMIKAAGFKLVLQMMTGLPGDSDDKTIETARKIIAAQPDAVRIYPTVIVKDTGLYELWKRGEYKEHTVEDAVRICSVIYPMFIEAGIKVIRMGLNPTDDLSGGDAAGGAYHPALGELVKCRIMRNKEEALLEGIPSGSAVKIKVPARLYSQAAGQKRSNISYLMQHFGLSGIKLIPDEICEDIELIND